ncbi:MAG: shikimate kinase [Acidimicrobiia bacterium]
MSRAQPWLHLVLTGPMGSGKTTVGEILAADLGVPFLDSDFQIEASLGVTGRLLAERQGVERLHDAEAEALEKALEGTEPSVIAAAASIGDRSDLVAALAGDDAFLVLLVGEPEVLVGRTDSGGHRRRFDMDEFRRSAARRTRQVGTVADLVVDVTIETPDQIARRILSAARDGSVPAN